MDNMQLWLTSSTDSINLNDAANGFFLNPDLEGLTGTPEIRSVNGLNAGYDGGWTATQLWAARLITIRGVIALNDKAAVETKRKALAKLMAQGKNESLQLKFVSESGNVYTTSVRTTYCTMALKRVFWRQEYQIQLRADDPLIYDDGGAELVAILRVMAGVNGFEIPFEIPFAIGDSADPTDVNVGDEATYPLITLKGDLHSPTIVNLTTNQQMQVLADIITHVEWKAYTTAQTIDGYLQIQDGLQDAPLTLTKLTGNATQKTYSGKNLFSGDFAQFDNQGGTGTTYKYFKLPTDGVYMLTLKAKNAITAGGSNTFIGFSYNGGNADVGYKWIYHGDSGATAGQVFSGTNLHNGENLGFVFMYPRTASDLQWLVENFEIQLESGSTATDYEPYCGGTPSPNPDYPQAVNVVSGAQTVNITGKNLCSNTVLQDANNIRFYIAGITSNTITFSSVINVATVSNSIYLRVDGTDKGRIGSISGGAGARQTATLTLTDEQAEAIRAGSESYLLLYKSNAGFTLPTESMIELGDQATPYEPYQAQSYDINLGGSNLFNFDNATLAQYPTSGLDIDRGANSITITSETTSGTQLQYATFANMFDATKTYTLSGKAKKIVKGTDGYPRLYVRWRGSSDGGSTWGSYNDLFVIANPTQGAEYSFSGQITGFATYQFMFYNNSGTPVTLGEKTTYYDIMLNEGSTAIPFAPYTTYAYELAKIGNYQDYIWNDNGTWKIHKEVKKLVLDGSESWQLDGSTNTYYSTTITDYAGSGNTPISDYFTGNTNVSGVGAMPDNKIAFNNNPAVPRFYVRFTSIFPAQLLTPWLSSHNTTVYYALATPTDTEITDSELVEQLNHIYELYQGVNNLFLIPSAGAQGEMEVTYATDKDVDYHEVVIDCQARTVTQDGQNLYPALAPGSEFIQLVPGQNRLYLTSTVSSDDGTAEVKFKKGNISI